MAIKIPVSAEFNDDDLKQQLGQITEAFNQLGREAAKVSGVKFQPISKASVDEARAMRREFETMLRISGGLRKTLEGSGQAGKPWHAVNWQQVFPDADQRQKYARTLVNRLREGSVTQHAPVPPVTSSGSVGGVMGSAMGGIAQAGLRAAGPVGNVAAGALGTGMRAGFGAGLAGLLGGIAALGVGKLVGGVAGKIGDAQDEAVQLDQLKRVLGDVNVSFDALRQSVRSAGDDIGVAFNEAGKLGNEFSRLANLSSSRSAEVAGGVALGGGLSRALGLDPSQGVGFLGTMRGLRQTQDEQGSRRLALLIGETIGKSDAFAKSGEVMDAISGFVTAQTRSSLGRAPVEGYAGQLAGLVGSGIAGLDPTGAAAVLSRALQTLSQGGGKGEASQFFSQSIAQRNGLGVIAGRLWQQNPMASISEAFGSDTAVGRYFAQNGLARPTGDMSNYAATLQGLRRSYGSDPMLLLSATANHLGINESQAAALLGNSPVAVNGMTKRLGRLDLDLGSLKGDSIGLLAQIESGDRSKLNGIASDLLGRKGKGQLSLDEARDLRAALNEGTDDGLRDLLATLTAQRGQAETEGSKTRDTIAGVGNTLQEYATKSLPLLNDSRAALMALAGKELGGKGPQGIREAYLRSEHDERVDGIRQGFDRYAAEQGKKARAGEIPKEIAEDNVRLATKQLGLDLKAEDDRHKAALEESRKQADRERKAADEARRRASGGTGVSSDLLGAVLQQESGGRHRGADGKLLRSGAGARGIAQIMPGTGADPGFGVRPLRDDSEAEHRRFASEYLNAMLRVFNGDKEKALAAYNAGPGRVQQAVRKHGGDWLKNMPEETRNYVPSVLGRESQGAAMPAEARAVEQAKRPDPLAARASLQGEMQLALDLTPEARRLLQGPAIMPSTRIGPARPFGVA